MVHEARTLGTAMASHQLNTLSQRYHVYKRTKVEVTNAKEALLDKSIFCADQLSAYEDCIRSFIKDEIVICIREIESRSAIISDQMPYEFDIVKDLLEKSAQGAVFTQSDQICRELQASYIQMNSITSEMLQHIKKYGEVVCFHPSSYILKHRLSKYKEWCSYLVHNESVPACRDVVNQFQRTLGEAAVKPQLQEIIGFSCHLHSVLHEDNIKLQQHIDCLQRELDSKEVHPEAAYSDAKNNIGQYLQLGNGNAFECANANNLYDLNEKLLLMENAASASGESLVDLTLNGKWFLDELYVITSVLTEFVGTIMHHGLLDEQFKAAAQCLFKSNQIYGFLKSMRTTFTKTILSNILHGVISENKSMLEMISAVSSLQEGIQPLQQLLNNLHLHLRCTVMNMSSPHQNAMEDAQKLRQKLNALKRQYESLAKKTKVKEDVGSSAFLLFNNLFESLLDQHRDMVNIIDNLDVPNEWQKIDQIKGGKDLAVSISVNKMN